MHTETLQLMLNWRIQLAIVVAASGFLTLIYPVGGNDGGYITRFALWFVQIGIGAAASKPCRTLSERWIAPNAHSYVQLAIAAFLIAVIVTLVVQITFKYDDFISGFALWPVVFPLVLAISAALSIIYILLERANIQQADATQDSQCSDQAITESSEAYSNETNPCEAKSSEAKSSEAKPSEAKPSKGKDTSQDVISARIVSARNSALHSRLSSKLKDATILALEAEDHYVMVHCDKGKELLLMRFSDAVLALNDLGLRVHRSWWVASNAIEKFERCDAKHLIHLNNGFIVPVSRRYQKEVLALPLKS
ncbi:MAG: hypothetical protein ACI93R_003501 [Flavobacteriales bacterium]|jgi:hypothetical protein